jgi:hypothetical protein
MSKKDVAKHLATLQDMFAECGKKYGEYSKTPPQTMQTLTSSKKAKYIIRKSKQATAAKSATANVIPKPAGRRSRNFNIFDEMNSRPHIVEVSKAAYKDLIVSWAPSALTHIHNVCRTRYISRLPPQTSIGINLSANKTRWRLEMLFRLYVSPASLSI